MRYAQGRWAEGRWAREPGRQFSVGGQSVSTTAAADEVLAHLWNPDATRSLWLTEASYTILVAATALDPIRLCRTTTVGTTPGVTVTPDLDNDFEREVTPDTGAILHMANFATEPILALPDLRRVSFPITSDGHNMVWLFDGLRVPPGTGIGFATTGAVAGRQADFYFRFWE